MNEQLTTWRASLELSVNGMSAYLGVPVNTYTKWEKGERQPPAAARKLFDVLRLVQVLAPQVHEQLINTATGTVSRDCV